MGTLLDYFGYNIIHADEAPDKKQLDKSVGGYCLFLQYGNNCISIYRSPYKINVPVFLSFVFFNTSEVPGKNKVIGLPDFNHRSSTISSGISRSDYFLYYVFGSDLLYLLLFQIYH